MVFRNPALVGGSTAFLVALSFVSANALWYQPHAHSGAFFVTRDFAGVMPAARAGRDDPHRAAAAGPSDRRSEDQGGPVHSQETRLLFRRRRRDCRTQYQAGDRRLSGKGGAGADRVRRRGTAGPARRIAGHGRHRAASRARNATALAGLGSPKSAWNSWIAALVWAPSTPSISIPSLPKALRPAWSFMICRSAGSGIRPRRLPARRRSPRCGRGDRHDTCRGRRRAELVEKFVVDRAGDRQPHLRLIVLDRLPGVGSGHPVDVAGIEVESLRIACTSLTFGSPFGRPAAAARCGSSRPARAATAWRRQSRAWRRTRRNAHAAGTTARWRKRSSAPPGRRSSRRPASDCARSGRGPAAPRRRTGLPWIVKIKLSCGTSHRRPL